MLCTRIKEITTGHTVIAVHDTFKLTTGDTGVVTGICSGCGGLILENQQEHYSENDFEILSTRVRNIPSDLISREKVVNAINDIIKVAAVNYINGDISFGILMKAIQYNVQTLGIHNDLMRPKNKL